MKSWLTVRGVVFSALFAALAVVLGFIQIHFGFSPVPITLGNLGVMLAGAILGGGYGFFSILLIVVLTAVGLPLLDGSGGVSTLLGFNGGYVWMWPIDALLVGFFVQRVRGNGAGAMAKAFIFTFLFGSLLDYVTGVPWLAHVAHVSFAKAMVLGCYPYLPGDAVKALVTALIAIPVRNVFPAFRIISGDSSQVVRAEA